MASTILAMNNTIVSIPPTLTYLLPPFSEDLSGTFVNGTHTNNDSVNALFASGAAAPFISYSQEFSDIIGTNAQIELVEKQNSMFAFEAGVWIPDSNEVWFSSSTYTPPSHLQILDLGTNKIRNATTSQKVCLDSLVACEYMLTHDAGHEP